MTTEAITTPSTQPRELSAEQMRQAAGGLESLQPAVQRAAGSEAEWRYVNVRRSV